MGDVGKVVGDGGSTSGGRVRFFVSYTGADRGWAEWIAWQLEDAGWSTVLQSWDFSVGQNFVARMDDALAGSELVLAVYSQAYFRSPYCRDEWTAAFMKDAQGKDRLIPVRVEDCEIPPLLRPKVYVDLVGLGQKAARTRLVDQLKPGRKKPSRAPRFPGRRSTPPVPAAAPVVAPNRKPAGVTAPGYPQPPGMWNIPGRNLGFVGRDQLLLDVREGLRSGRPRVRALHGMAGVGKTQLAREYAWRFAGDYDLAWWINADSPLSLHTGLAALADDLGIPVAEDPAATATQVVSYLAANAAHRRWLLIFDNAESVETVSPYLPAGAHVLITSRSPAWRQLDTTVPLAVPVLDRAETISLLQRRIPDLQEATANRLAELVGDYPLAVAQIAAYLDDNPMTPTAYLDLYTGELARAAAAGQAADYPASVAVTVALSARRLADTDPAAVQLLHLAVYLDPDAIPTALFTTHPDLLPSPLAGAAAAPESWARVIGRVQRSGLAYADPDLLTVHRLVQAILRDRMSEQDRHIHQATVHALLAATNPADPADPDSWPRWQQLLPHLLASDAVHSTNPQTRRFLLDSCRYLRMSGQARTARDLAEQAHHRWQQDLGADHPDTLHAALALAASLFALGDYTSMIGLAQGTLTRCRQVFGDDHPGTLQAAHELGFALHGTGQPKAAADLLGDVLTRRRRVLGDDHPDTLDTARSYAHTLLLQGKIYEAHTVAVDALTRCRRVLGPDHPDTLHSAHSLAGALHGLGEYQAARELGEDTLTRRRRVLGPDHPDTLRSADGLANVLYGLGEYQAARELGEDTLTRRRRVLGSDHPTTLHSAYGLAGALHGLGEYQAARELGEDTLTCRRRVLGPDHPDTLHSAHSLAVDLYGLGEYQAARELGEDTLTRCRRVLGPDHPTTLHSAHSLASDLHALGEKEAAVVLYREAWTGRRRRLSDNHPHTRDSAGKLDLLLEQLGQPPEARLIIDRTPPS